MNCLHFSVLCALLLSFFGGISQALTKEELASYQAGLSHFQDDQFDKAEASFRKALSVDPENPIILYNWGLSHFKLGRNGWAYAAWRKALALSPETGSIREALGYLADKASLPGKKTPNGYWELFRARVLIFLPVTPLVALTALLLCCSGWLLIKHFAQRSSAIEDELPLPTIPWAGIVFASLFLLVQGATIAKFYDHFRPRGIIVSETALLKTAPEETSSDLFEIGEGAEVLIYRSSGDWLQVSYPSGLAGWTLKEQVFQVSGRKI